MSARSSSAACSRSSSRASSRPAAHRLGCPRRRGGAAWRGRRGPRDRRRRERGGPLVRRRRRRRGRPGRARPAVAAGGLAGAVRPLAVRGRVRDRQGLSHSRHRGPHRRGDRACARACRTHAGARPCGRGRDRALRGRPRRDAGAARAEAGHSRRARARAGAPAHAASRRLPRAEPDATPVVAGIAAGSVAFGFALRSAARSAARVLPTPLADVAVAAAGTYAISRLARELDARLPRD